MKADNSQIARTKHIKIDYARDRFAAHPRQGGIFSFADGEISVIYNRAPCNYAEAGDVRHGPAGYRGRGKTILARSYDRGGTWDRAHDIVLFDETAPIEERRGFVTQVQDNPELGRKQIDLSAPDTIIYFGRTWAGEGDPPGQMCFAIRSADRGRTWESVPTPIEPPSGYARVHKDGHPLVRLPDGTHLGAMTVQRVNGLGGVHLYGSDDDGLSWEPLAQICSDPSGKGRPTYAGLLLLSSGRLQCYTLNIAGWRNVIQMNYSNDGGYSWSVPRPIVRWGQSPWGATLRGHTIRGPWHYRSPWPMILADGRVVVLFARRKVPYGMGLVVSEDDGISWSQEHVLREDASHADIGYPVAAEIAPNRIFTAYYYTLDDGNGFGGTRFIAGTFFTLK